MKRFLDAPKARRWMVGFAVLGAAFSVLLPSWTMPAKSPRAAIGEKLKIPVGTVLPVSLEHALSSKDQGKDEAIEGRIMQDVPLPNGDTIPAGSKVRGSITDIASASQGMASITFRFISIQTRDTTIPIYVGLRAMAPYLDVQRAKTPYQESAGSPGGWATTLQIGGDVRFGDGGKVTNGRHRVVGKATRNDGVLARLEDFPGSPCEGWPDVTHGPQAVWVFSVSACGIFDMKGVRIARAGNKAPIGDITLTKDEGDIKIMESSALLLRVVK